MTAFRIEQSEIEAHNEERRASLEDRYARLGEELQARGIDLESVAGRLANLQIALPTWGVGTGGTRFGRFPGPGEPRHVFDKLEDCGAIQALVRCTPRVSVHIPWDRTEDMTAVRDAAAAQGLGFDAINSNTFQDQPGQKLSYKFGSLAHTDAAVRAQAIEHNLECIEIGRQLGSTALTVWIADGSNFPGQQDLTGAFERYLESMRKVYDGLPPDWRVFLEHKFYEPAFYATVIADWGSSLMAAQALGDRARCLVDLGHHAPNTNIEQIVARLIHARRLAGFHFNDSKYGDDDLDTGAIDPFRLFLVFNELVEAELRGTAGFDPAYMLDQSHNVTDPIESLVMSAVAVQRACAQALLVDRDALHGYQRDNDALMALRTLKAAYATDVEPLIETVRLRKEGAADPLMLFRETGYRAKKAEERPQDARTGGGIV